MAYAEALPSPALRSLIECYWRITGPADGHRVLPDGCIDILLVGDARRAEVVGTMTRAIVASPSMRGAIGIRFRPGEAARLLPDAPRELTDGDTALADVWTAAGELEDTLATALGPLLQRDLAEVAPRIDSILSHRLATAAGPVDLRVRSASALLTSGASVHETARQIGLSERQLARRFEARVGIAPKLFGRVMRLQRAARALAEGANPSSAAALAGYADQAHFTRDAQDLAGVSPRTLAKELGADASDVSDSFKTELVDLS
jgi:AraC-like DNA-binding protein